MKKVENIKIIFLHGNGGGSVHGDDQWFPYLKKQFEKLDLQVIARDFPDADLARTAYWLPFLKDELKADEHSLLIGASSGAVAAMRFAENNKIFGSILVSPSYTDLGDPKEKASGYFDKPWNWDAIKKNQNWIVQFYSTDDPYIPTNEAHFIHKQLDTEYYEFTNQGHFWPKHEFPEVVAIVKEKLKI